MVFRTILIWIKAHRLITVIVVLILVFGIFVMLDRGSLRSSNSATQKATSTSTTATTATTSVTKSGILICLVQSQKDKAPAQCVLTLKADDGKYYKLVDADSKKPSINTADLNKHIQVSGTLTSSNSTDNSNDVGTIAVQKYGEIQ